MITRFNKEAVVVSRRVQVWAVQQAKFQGPRFTYSFDYTIDFPLLGRRFCVQDMQLVKDNFQTELHSSCFQCLCSAYGGVLEMQLKAAED